MGEPAPKSNTCKFTDVQESDYFYKACIWGNENHIVEIKINKFKYKIWKDRFFKNRGDIKFPEGYLELNVISDETLGQEITLLFTKYGVYYLNDSVETELFNMPDFLSDIADLTISWMYNEVPEL